MHGSTGIQNLGAKEGSIRMFTENRLNREQVLTQIVKVLWVSMDIIMEKINDI